MFELKLDPESQKTEEYWPNWHTFKKGSRGNPGNYGPVSFTSVPGKLGSFLFQFPLHASFAFNAHNGSLTFFRLQKIGADYKRQMKSYGCSTAWHQNTIEHSTCFTLCCKLPWELYVAHGQYMLQVNKNEYLCADSSCCITESQDRNILCPVQPVYCNFGTGCPLDHGYIVLPKNKWRHVSATLTCT